MTAPHEMRQHNQQRRSQYRALRNWALGLGSGAFLVVAGGGRLFATEISIALVSFAFALVVVAALLHGLSRREHTLEMAAVASYRKAKPVRQVPVDDFEIPE